jgi:choline dehydrogenase-like flavoprotein
MSFSPQQIAGGGSAINGRIHVRGAARDYDDWARYLDDDGWSWRGILPYFKKSETFTPPIDSYQAQANVTWDMRYHGGDGPIGVTWPPGFLQRALYSIAAEKTLGIPQKADQGSGDIVGGFWHPMASRPTDKYSRSYSKREYVEPIMDRPNLHFLAERTVTRILFDGQEAKGVQVCARAVLFHRNIGHDEFPSPNDRCACLVCRRAGQPCPGGIAGATW